MALRTIHYLLRDHLQPTLSSFVEAHITNKLGLHHARRFTSSAFSTLRYSPTAPRQDHPQRPRNEDEVTQVSPRFFFLCDDVTATLTDRLDQMFHSMSRSVAQHIQRWMADLTPLLPLLLLLTPPPLRLHPT